MAVRSAASPESSFSADAEGGAVTFVPGLVSRSGQRVLGDHDAPVRPAGTAFVDFRVCLDGVNCVTQTDALLYVPPGNSDFALVFDTSWLNGHRGRSW